MKTNSPHQQSQPTAFTLVELLLVIAVIGTLAGLILGVMPAMGKKAIASRAQAEMAQLSIAIEAYKAKLGFYPPDNPSNAVPNQLYFELAGTVQTNVDGEPGFVTLDGTARAKSTSLPYYFGVSGFVNSSTSTRSTDEAAAAINFLKTGLKPDQVGANTIGPDLGTIKVLSFSGGSPGIINSKLGNPAINPWCYVSSHPTNNPGSYDLWVDVAVNGTTNRISNWNSKWIKLP